MKYFFDTEFIEDGKTIELLSMGMVAEDGRELLFQAGWTDQRRANAWVAEHVLPNLAHPDYPDRPGLAAHTLIPNPEQACEAIGLFLADDPKPEFWAYYADYDWVVFCQLYGRMMDLPDKFPRYCRDFKQWMDQHNLRAQSQTEGLHNALDDARWVKREYNRLIAEDKERLDDLFLKI